MPEKTLVAHLPPMTSADLARFEAEGGVWGQQRAIRRQQVNVMGAFTAASLVGGTSWAVLFRRNTWLVGAMCAPAWVLFGAVSGNFAGTLLFPSVACNKETTMMRRVWWAKQCAKDWDMSQIKDDVWTAKYPHEAFPNRAL